MDNFEEQPKTLFHHLWIILKNSQTYFKNLRCSDREIGHLSALCMKWLSSITHPESFLNTQCNRSKETYLQICSHSQNKYLKENVLVMQYRNPGILLLQH